MNRSAHCLVRAARSHASPFILFYILSILEDTILVDLLISLQSCLLVFQKRVITHKPTSHQCFKNGSIDRYNWFTNKIDFI